MTSDSNRPTTRGRVAAGGVAALEVEAPPATSVRKSQVVVVTGPAVERSLFEAYEARTEHASRPGALEASRRETVRYAVQSLPAQDCVRLARVVHSSPGVTDYRLAPTPSAPRQWVASAPPLAAAVRAIAIGAAGQVRALVPVRARDAADAPPAAHLEFAIEAESITHGNETQLELITGGAAGKAIAGEAPLSLALIDGGACAEYSPPAQEVSAAPGGQPLPPSAAECGAATPPRENPFRAEALRAKTEERVSEALPEVSGSSWAVLAVVSTLLMAALVLAYFGHVEETSEAGGVLLVRGGPRPVLAQVSGAVTGLDVIAGEIVQAGQSIARIDATELQARVQRDTEQLALVNAEHDRTSRINTQVYRAEVRSLERKRDLLNERAELKAVGIHDREGRVRQMEHAARAGVASQSDALDVREAARGAAEDLLLIRQQITETDLLLTDDKKSYDADQDRLRRELEEAKSNLAQSRALLDMTTVRAPVAGRVESLLAAAGQVVNSGTIMARIIPDGAVTSAVVFAPVKDASFLLVGLDANIEFASLPVSEFGRTPGRVTRVSPDVASAEEAAGLMGKAPDEPVIRVELELLPSPELLEVHSKLRSGERLIARLTTRERRLIALVFDFLRKWYDP